MKWRAFQTLNQADAGDNGGKASFSILEIKSPLESEQPANMIDSSMCSPMFKD